MLEAVERTARSAAHAWRRARAVQGALIGLSVALIGVILCALALEFGTGLIGDHLLPLLAWFVAVPVGAILAASHGLSLAAAATEADQRAGLSDRLGTALEFAGEPGPLAAMQRHDAGVHALATGVAGLFPLPWRAHLPRLAVLLVLALAITGAALTFQLRPPPAPIAIAEPDDDLLASIDRSIDTYQERGDKNAARLLTDLDRTIRRIRAREDQLRRIVRARAPRPTAEAPPVEPDALPPPPRAAPEGPRITADDLARLEDETAEQLALTDVQAAEVVSDLFAHSRAATELMHEFHEQVMHEAEVTKAAENAAVRTSSSGVDSTSGAVENSDLVNNAAFTNRSNNDATNNLANEREDMIRRDLSDESQAAHDRAHDTQESFNQFLRDFVKDVQDIVAEAAAGRARKANEDRKVQVDTGQGVVDKSDAMAETGFEEVGDTKRHSDAAPPEDLAGKSNTPGQGKPPEGAEIRQGTGEANGPMMKGESKSGTSAGAKGAGTGDPEQGGGLSTLLHGLKPQDAGRLEQALGQIARGRMPPETRDALLDRMARHKVQAGLASEADDVLVDYFAEAEELMVANQDALPPLFRDYAQSYFDAIRPGGARPDANSP